MIPAQGSASVPLSYSTVLSSTGSTYIQFLPETRVSYVPSTVTVAIAYNHTCDVGGDCWFFLLCYR